MSKTRADKTGELVAKDENGNEYLVYIITNYQISNTPLGDHEIPVGGRYALKDGTTVTRISKGNFTVTIKGVLIHLTSDDPRAT
jgi:hypothetical protein